MVEDSNLGVARARETGEETENSDLKHRMDEARESITDAVSEIKDSITDQNIGANVSDVLDWRRHARNHPIACGIGALGVGIVVGYGIAGLIENEIERAFDAAEETHPLHLEDEGGGPSAFSEGHVYAAHALAVAADDDRPTTQVDKPGIIKRFKETRAYDRLQEEVGDLGNRFMDELSNAARTIVLPALFNKLKELIGVDLSNKQRGSLKDVSTTRPDTPQSSEASVLERSQIGKPVYPSSKVSQSKFDRLVNDTLTSNASAESGPNINLNYDDRYERESRHFSRGENRGFDAGTPNENRTPDAEAEKANRDVAPGELGSK